MTNFIQHASALFALEPEKEVACTKPEDDGWYRKVRKERHDGISLVIGFPA